MPTTYSSMGCTNLSVKMVLGGRSRWHGNCNIKVNLFSRCIKSREVQVDEQQGNHLTFCVAIIVKHLFSNEVMRLYLLSLCIYKASDLPWRPYPDFLKTSNSSRSSAEMTTGPTFISSDNLTINGGNFNQHNYWYWSDLLDRAGYNWRVTLSWSPRQSTSSQSQTRTHSTPAREQTRTW